jgi:hypothetical protein
VADIKVELRCGRRQPAAEEAAEGSFAEPGKTMTGAAQPGWRVFL